MEKCLVVFVHGLGADDVDWWGTTKDILYVDQELKENYEFTFFRYQTDKATSPANPIKNKFGFGKYLASLEDLGGQLSTHISNKDKNVSSIKIFGHSMGGLVISASLKKLSTKRNIYNKITDVAFCGTPLGGSKVASLISKVLKLTSSKHTKALTIESNELKTVTAALSEYVTLKKENEDNKILLTFFKITEDEVVKTNTERYGEFEEEVKNKNIYTNDLFGKHSDSVKDLTLNDDNYKSIKSWIQNDNTKKNLNKDKEKSIVNKDKENVIENKDDFAITELKKYRQELENKDPIDLSENEEAFLKRNYLLIERDSTSTIFKSGCIINSAIFNIEMIKDGHFIADYFCKTSFKETVKFPKFEKFKSNLRRFSSYSFHACILDYKRNGIHLKEDQRPNFDFFAIEESESSIGVEFKMLNCEKGDVFQLAYSITIPKEYSEDNIKLMKDDPEKYASSYTMNSPIGIKRINFQEEIYGGEAKNNFKPVMVNKNKRRAFIYTTRRGKLSAQEQEKEMFQPITSRNLFYKQNRWNIYFHEIKDKNISLYIG